MIKSTFEFGAKGLPPAESDGRLDAPAFQRNHEPIWQAIGGLLVDKTGSVLEIGSGTGQHAATYAQRAPQLTWWPSDILASHLASIAAWRQAAGLANLRSPQSIDLMDADWTWQGDDNGDGKLAAILCFNVIHISPWRVAQNLFAGAGRLLSDGGVLILYGPYRRNGAHTASSNAAFDDSLRARNSEWGVRDLADVTTLATSNGLALARIVEMPANNLTVIFEKRGRDGPKQRP
jgi:SAM-dependent methyltransferase